MSQEQIVLENVGVECDPRDCEMLNTAADTPKACIRLFRHMAGGKLNPISVTNVHGKNGYLTMRVVLQYEPGTESAAETIRFVSGRNHRMRIICFWGEVSWYDVETPDQVHWIITKQEAEKGRNAYRDIVNTEPKMTQEQLTIDALEIRCSPEYYEKFEAAKDNPEECVRLMREISDGKLNPISVTGVQFQNGYVGMRIVLLLDPPEDITQTLQYFLIDETEKERKMTIMAWGFMSNETVDVEADLHAV
jgi:hypothetical protein